MWEETVRRLLFGSPGCDLLRSFFCGYESVKTRKDLVDCVKFWLESSLPLEDRWSSCLVFFSVWLECLSRNGSNKLTKFIARSIDKFGMKSEKENTLKLRLLKLKLERSASLQSPPHPIHSSLSIWEYLSSSKVFNNSKT
jgi:hypothetical protein